MKSFIKKVLSIIYKVKSFMFFIFNSGEGNKVTLSSFFFRSSYSLFGNQNVLEFQGKVEKSVFKISGNKNIVSLHSASIFNSSISINGNCNQIFFEEGVYLVDSKLILRGENCKIFIGKESTFGGVRIINVGNNNNILVGHNCLFADFIEVWSSDTHSIYDSEGKIINPELPIIIGNNVWIGSYVKILKGVTIGDGAILGMNTLVTKNVDPKTVNVGNPMRCIKENVTWKT